MLGGVCGGLAQYLNVDVTLVRVFFVLLAMTAGTGLLLYLAMWLIVPEEGQGTARDGTEIASYGSQSGARRGDRQGALFIGSLLLFFGAIFLVQNIVGGWIPWLSFGTLWPLLLILAGAALLWNRMKGA
jgi:phage shock protein C